MASPCRAPLDAGQRSWLRARVSCGRDADCIADAFTKRIAELNSLQSKIQRMNYWFVANTQSPDNYLALRASPNGQQITTMPNGTVLQVLDRRPDKWWRVRIVGTGEEGWALSGEGNREWIECCQKESHATAAPTTSPAATANNPVPTSPAAAAPTTPTPPTPAPAATAAPASVPTPPAVPTPGELPACDNPDIINDALQSRNQLQGGGIGRFGYINPTFNNLMKLSKATAEHINNTDNSKLCKASFTCDMAAAREIEKNAIGPHPLTAACFLINRLNEAGESVLF